MSSSRLFGVVVLVLCSCVFGVRQSSAQASCAIQGVWVMESATVDGKPEPQGTYRSQKIVTATHFSFVSNGGDGSYGGGTYKLAGGTYTEHLEYFYKTDYLNRDMPATCRIVNGKWHHAFEWPVIEKGKELRRQKIEEVWRKVG